MSWATEFTTRLDDINVVSFNGKPVEKLKVKGQQIWYGSLDELSKFYKVPFYINQKVVYQNELKVISFMNDSYFEITPEATTREFYVWYEHGDANFERSYKFYPRTANDTFQDVVDGLIQPLEIQALTALKGDKIILENVGDEVVFMQNDQVVLVAEQDLDSYLLEYTFPEDGVYQIYNNSDQISLFNDITVNPVESELINIHDLQGKVFGPYLGIDLDQDGVDAGVDINDSDSNVGSTISVQITDWAIDGIETIAINEAEAEAVDFRNVNPKEIVTVEAQPDLGKIFDQWEIEGIDGLVYSDLLNPVIKFNMPRNNVTLKPYYKDEVI